MPQKDPRILLLSSDESTRATIRELLHPHWTPQEALTLADAHQAVADYSFDIIVLDVASVAELDAIADACVGGTSEPILLAIAPRADGEALLERVEAGTLFRFLFRPFPAGQARLALDAALRRHADGPEPDPEPQPDEAIELMPSSDSRTILLAGGLSAVAVLTAGGLFLSLYAGDDGPAPAAMVVATGTVNRPADTPGEATLKSPTAGLPKPITTQDIRQPPGAEAGDIASTVAAARDIPVTTPAPQVADTPRLAETPASALPASDTEWPNTAPTAHVAARQEVPLPDDTVRTLEPITGTLQLAGDIDDSPDSGRDPVDLPDVGGTSDSTILFTVEPPVDPAPLGTPSLESAVLESAAHGSASIEPQRGTVAGGDQETRFDNGLSDIDPTLSDSLSAMAMDGAEPPLGTGMPFGASGAAANSYETSALYDTAGTLSGIADADADADAVADTGYTPNLYERAPAAQASTTSTTSTTTAPLGRLAMVTGDAAMGSAGNGPELPDELPPVIDTAPPDVTEAPVEMVRTVYTAPEYPRYALQRDLEGWVDVSFRVGPDGIPIDISVVDSRPRQTFDRAALRAVKDWRYKPPVENGQYIIERTEVRILFSLD